MALVVFTWDLPPGERVAVYNETVRTAWVPSVLQQPGVTAVRGYRNPHHMTPQVMVHLECDSLASCQRFLASERYGELVFELRALGCTNMALHVWDASPLVPEPVTPCRRLRRGQQPRPLAPCTEGDAVKEDTPRRCLGLPRIRWKTSISIAAGATAGTLTKQRTGAVRTMVAPEAVAGMLQGAQPLTDPCAGFHLGRRSLLHDRDTTCTQVCDGLWRATAR